MQNNISLRYVLSYTMQKKPGHIEFELYNFNVINGVKL